MSDSKLSARLASIYYIPKGYWKGIAVIQNLSARAKFSENLARGWLEKQAIWQIYRPAPRHIPWPKFDIATSNEVHQADLLFLPHITSCLEVERRTSMHSPSLTLPRATRKPSLWPQKRLKRLLKLCLASTDGARLSGQNCTRSTPGASSWARSISCSAKHDVEVRRGRVDIHRDQGIVEQFNRTLAERLFGHQYAQEMRLSSGERSSESVARLPAVVAALMEKWLAHWKMAFWDHQDTICDTKALLHCSRPSCWPSQAKAPFRCWHSLSVPTQQAGRRSSPCDWSSMVFDGSPTWALGDQAWRACVVLFAGWASAGIRPRGTSSCAPWHTATAGWGLA